MRINIRKSSILLALFLCSLTLAQKAQIEWSDTNKSAPTRNNFSDKKTIAYEGITNEADNIESENKIRDILSLINSKKGNLGISKSIKIISSQFMGTPYKKGKILEESNHREVINADLRTLNCFNYLDYVVAFRDARNKNDFYSNLTRIRYIDSQVSYLKRKHYFTDWAYREEKFADDITKQISDKYETVTKNLNEGDDGAYVKGIPVVQRELSYIPTNSVKKALRNLKTGDLIGIYSPKDGLDVSHVGFYINKEKKSLFRHASSKGQKKVVDESLLKYLKNKKGIIVLRLRN